MFKTGVPFIDLFSLVVVFLPLLPVIIILARKIYQLDVLNFLMILCLINFISGLNLQLLPVTHTGRLGAAHVFSLLELVILTQLFKSGLTRKYRELIDILTIAFLSAVITYYLLKGVDQHPVLLEETINGWIILSAALSLLQIVHRNYLRIFNSPLFWIATGTLFYFVIAMLLELITATRLSLPQSITTEKTVLLNIAATTRYLFYTLAAWIYNRPTHSDQQF